MTHPYRVTCLFLCWLALAGTSDQVRAQPGVNIFADGFESGDLSRWSSAQDGGLCTSGPSLGGLLEGDLGPAPVGSYEQLACVEIHNDQGFERLETAFSGIPIPITDDLRSTDDLAVIGPGNRRLAAQFRVLSRWSGAPDDPTLPIRWLQVLVPARLGANDTVSYSLRRYDVLPATGDPYAVTLDAQGGDQVVDTGLATFTLDPANPALIKAMSIDLDDDGIGRYTVYSHSPGAGPKLVFADGGGDVTLDTSVAGALTVDAGGFSVVEAGPVKVTAALRGHFSAAGGTSRCTRDGLDYERFGYTLLVSFLRASRDVRLQFHVRNECSDGWGGDWTDDAVTISQASLEFPFILASPTSHFAGAGAVASSPAGFRGLTRVEQRKGAGVPWTRRARIRLDAVEQESAELFSRPLVAVSDATFAVAAQIPWMRFREPQAITVDDTTVSLRFISEGLIVGEGKGIWNFARLSLFPVPPGGAGALAARLESVRVEGAAELERGLLVRASREHVNRSRVFASVGTDAPSAVKTAYLAEINDLHDDTVLAGGQWDRAKPFGSQLWPEVQSDGAAITNPTPFDHQSAMNYWNPSGAELYEFLRAGDPKWVWDFAMPQSWLQMFTAYLNVGDEDHSNRNGLAVNSGGSGEGQWHRSAYGSDDYSYNMGQPLAYVLRPTAPHLDRFRQAGRALVGRYDVPQAQQGDREQWVSQVDVTRQVIQHFEMLANCAEFVPGADGDACRARLGEVVTELAQENLAPGMMCQGDIPSATTCGQPQQFMQNALMYLFFHRYLLNWGDAAGLLRRALVNGPVHHYNFGVGKLADGVSIDVASGWAAGLECDLTNGGSEVATCVPALDSDNNFFMYNPTKPQTAALLLMAHDLEPSIGFCQIVKNAYDTMNLAGLWSDFNGDDAGWWKGAAQMMQATVFGVGLYDVCADP